MNVHDSNAMEVGHILWQVPIQYEVKHFLVKQNTQLYVLALLATGKQLNEFVIFS